MWTVSDHIWDDVGSHVIKITGTDAELNADDF